jgi:hypothetical protein
VVDEFSIRANQGGNASMARLDEPRSLENGNLDKVERVGS